MATGYQLTLRGKIVGIYDVQNVFHFVKGVDTVDADLPGVCALWLASMFTPISTYISAGYTAQEFGIRKYVDGVWGLESLHPIAIAGLDETEALPFQNAAVLVAYTGLKRVFGRKFWGGITVHTIEVAALSTAALVAFATSLSAWLAGQSGEDPNVVIFTRIFRKETGTFEAVFSGKVDLLIGSMRRRKLGVGS